MKIVQYMKAAKKLAEQDKYKGRMENGNISFVNWWRELPEESWFTRFIRYYFPDSSKHIRFYSVFGPRYRFRDEFRGIRIFYSGENLDEYIRYPFLEMKQSSVLFNEHRHRCYGDYALKDMDISLGFGMQDDPKYIRFPLWIPFEFDPEDSYQVIRRKIEEMNQACSSADINGAVLIASHDDYGMRSKICADLQSVLPITYGGNWRNNSRELKEKYQDDKIRYLNKFKFNICAENVDADYYCTEKLFDSFKAGTIPIYHGAHNNPEADIVNRESVIFWNFEGDNAENVEMIRKLMADETYYSRFMLQSKLNDHAAEYVYGKMMELKNRLEELGV